MVSVPSFIKAYFTQPLSLHNAAKRGDVDCINDLLNEDCNPVDHDAHGYTPVDYAIFSGKNEALVHLLNPAQVEGCGVTKGFFKAKSKKRIEAMDRFIKQVRFVLRDPRLIALKEIIVQLSDKADAERLISDSSIDTDLESTKASVQVESPIDELKEDTQTQDKNLDADQKPVVSNEPKVQLENEKIDSELLEEDLNIDQEIIQSKESLPQLETEDFEAPKEIENPIKEVDQQINQLLEGISNSVKLYLMATLPPNAVLYLVEQKTDLLNLKDSSGFTTYHYAALNPNQLVLFHLLQKSDSIESEGITPLDLLIFQVKKKDPLKLSEHETLIFLIDWIPKLASAIGEVLPTEIIGAFNKFIASEELREVAGITQIFGAYIRFVSVFALVKKSLFTEPKKTLFTLAYFTLNFIPILNLIPKAVLMYCFAKYAYRGIKSSTPYLRDRPLKTLFFNSVRVLNTQSMLNSFYDAAKTAAYFFRHFRSSDFFEFCENYYSMLFNNTFMDQKELTTQLKNANYRSPLFLEHYSLKNRVIKVHNELKEVGGKIEPPFLAPALDICQLELESEGALSQVRKLLRSCGILFHPDKNKDPSAEEYFLTCRDAGEVANDYIKFGSPAFFAQSSSEQKALLP